MYKSNKNLCELTNRITTNLILFGFARVDSSWNGTVLAPLYSRLYYITDGNAKIFLKDGKEIAREEVFGNLKDEVYKKIVELSEKSEKKLLDDRYKRFRKFGIYDED